MLHIGHFVNTFPCLSQTFILNQITGLLDRGHHLHIYAKKGEESPIRHTDVKQYDLISNTVYFKDNQIKVPGNILLRYIKGLRVFWGLFINNPKVALRAISIKKFGISALSLAVLYRAASFAKISFPDFSIIHAHFGPNGNLAVLLRELGIIRGKIVTTFYGYDVTRAPKRYGRDMYKKLFSDGDLFLVLSSAMKKQLIELGCDPAKIKIHHLGIDTKKFAFHTPRFNGQRDMKLITVGRLVEKKGIEYAIRAVAEILALYPHVRYTIIGDGPLKNKLESIIRENGISEAVDLLGPKDQNDIRKYLSESDVFLAPSVTAEDGDTEGTPTVLMEAQALGLPVVSTIHSGIPEVVEDGITGYLAPERDVEALADRIEKLIYNSNLRRKMGKKGRRKIEKEFDINVLNARLEKVFKDLCEGHEEAINYV